MHAPDEQSTILAHPALAGRVLYVRTGRHWAAREIHPEGALGACRPIEGDPAAHGWRGGPRP